MLHSQEEAEMFADFGPTWNSKSRQPTQMELHCEVLGKVSKRQSGVDEGDFREAEPPKKNRLPDSE